MIAKYYRLSSADGDLGRNGKDESNSIENQRLLINNYIKSKKEFVSCPSQEYVDDGYTGTNFKRPGFEHMMDDVRFGNIDIIIVKDMSRFGRDYIGVGDYLEQIFPALSVRFIAVNNNYDSDKYKGTTMGLEMTIGNFVNSMYSKDVSKKIRTANRSRWKSGYRAMGAPPFGYMFHPEIKGRYAIDPGAAQIVRHIFELALEGLKTSQIAWQLNEEKIPAPSEYYHQHPVNGKGNYPTVANMVIWDSSKVRKVIKNYEYTGALVLGKRQLLIPGSKISRVVPDDERIIHDGVNEAIVTKEEFERAQQIIHMQTNRGVQVDKDYLLKGKIRCGTCGKMMVTRHRGTEQYIWCDYAGKTKMQCGCSPQRYSMKNVENVVRYSIYNYCLSLVELSGRIEKISKLEKERKDIRLNGIKSMMVQLNQRKKDKMQLYESYAAGNISLDVYKAKRDEVDAEILSITEKKAELENMKTDEPVDKATDQFIEDTKGIVEEMEKTGEKNLTRQIVEKMIEAVYIYDEDHMEVKFCFGDTVNEVWQQVMKKYDDIRTGGK